MPQSPANNWLKLYNTDPEKYKVCLHRIGNLTILKEKRNKTNSNKDFLDKCKQYKESGIMITNKIPDKWKVFDFSTVEERQKEIFEFVKNIWSRSRIK